MKFTVDVAIGLRKFFSDIKLGKLSSEDKIIVIKIIKLLKPIEIDFNEFRDTIIEKVDVNNTDDKEAAEKALNEELNKEVNIIIPKFNDLDNVLLNIFESNPDMVYSQIERLENTLNNIYSNYGETTDTRI